MQPEAKPLYYLCFFLSIFSGYGIGLSAPVRIMFPAFTAFCIFAQLCGIALDRLPIYHQVFSKMLQMLIHKLDEFLKHSGQFFLTFSQIFQKFRVCTCRWSSVYLICPILLFYCFRFKTTHFPQLAVPAQLPQQGTYRWMLKQKTGNKGIPHRFTGPVISSVPSYFVQFCDQCCIRQGTENHLKAFQIS